MSAEVIEFITWALLGLSVSGCVFLGLSTLAACRLAAASGRPVAAPRPVTILKPLCGEDAGLAENLRSFCRQDHPRFQIVFGVQAEDDAAIPVVRRLMAEFPAADLALVIDGRRRGRNLKVANLHNILPSARHADLVISDSDMRVGPDYLATVTAPLADEGVGVVTCLYRGVPEGGPWSRFACLYINHNFLPQAAVGRVIGAAGGCFGASIAFRRATLDRIGGLAAIEDSLADDFALGAAVRRAGLAIELSPYIVDNVIAEPSLKALFRHELRWARTIRLVEPWGFLGLVTTQPVVMAALALCLGTLPLATPIMLILALLCRFATARILDRALRLPRAPLHLLALRDVLSFAVFVASFFARRVEWRDQTFHIGPGGELTLDGDGRA